MMDKISIATAGAPLPDLPFLSGSRVALAIGAYDLPTAEELEELEELRDDLDGLVVALLSDAALNQQGAEARISEVARAALLAALPVVDFVHVAGVDEVGELARALRPCRVLLGPGADGQFAEDVFPTAPQEPTDVIRTAFAAAGRGGAGPALRVREYLAGLRTHLEPPAVARALERLSELRVLVVSDLIIDEYCYCRVSGTVSKWPVISAVFESLHQMAGGGAAIARHIREFAGAVDYLGTRGGRDGNAEVATRLLQGENVGVHLLEWPGSHTVTKRRYITGGYPNPIAPRLRVAEGRANIRLFEIGYMPQGLLPSEIEKEICERLEEILPDYDAVVVADFGHGLVTPRIAEVVAAGARWWAINAQTNSSNFGFNRITKYRGADFVCIDELEARIPSGNKHQPLEQLVGDLFTQLQCSSLMITRGSDGLLYSNGSTLLSAPALATRVVDTVGAGDAVLSLASLCRAAGLDEELSVFLSSCAGALASAVVGNEEPIRKREVLRFTRSLLSRTGVPA